LTNLKANTSTSASSSSSAANKLNSNINNNNVKNNTNTSSSSQIQTVYTLSKSSLSTPRKEHYDLSKTSPPSLTLPPSPVSHMHSHEKSNKINSSTFYPFQNNHATYTLPKLVTGKTSLNSQISNVVSKVPSVISIPPPQTLQSSHVRLKEANNNAKDTKDHKTSSSSSTSKFNRSKKSMSSTISQCQMPSYPKHSIQSSTDTQTNKSKTTYSTTTTSSTTTNSSSSSSSSTTSSSQTATKHLPVCTTSKNCLNPKEHFLPNDTSLDDDYLSECENCKIAQSSKYYLDSTLNDMTPQETMTLQRKSLDENKDDQDQSYYRTSHTLPTNSKKNA